MNPKGEPDVDDINFYNELPRPVREWLANLRPDDIVEIEDARKFMRGIKTAGFIWKYVVLAAFGGLLIVGPGIEYLGKIWQSFRTPSGP